jgi:predicted nuclease of predicted toxin-antitoxin system
LKQRSVTEKIKKRTLPDDRQQRYFVDQCVPESVAKLLEEHGFEVVRLRHKIAVNSPDTLVAAVAEANNAILVTMDGDFKSIASRNSIGQRRFRDLSLLRFERCPESRAAERLGKALSLVQHEWDYGAGQKDRRMFVVITTETIRTHR